MSETSKARREITFNDGLPLATHGIFTHENEKWIAVPLTKYVGFQTILDNNIGVLNRVRDECVRWLSTHPDDVARVGMLLAIIAKTDEHAKAPP